MNILEISIDTNKIPTEVGHITSFEDKQSLHIDSMTKFCEWVQSKIRDQNELRKVVYTVYGAMPNCAALQIGLLLAGKGEVVFKTTKNFKRGMKVV